MTLLPPDLGQNLHRFNILSLNAQSLRGKYDELTIFIELARQQNIRFHAICIKESWMDSNADFSQINIEGYNVFAEGKRSECSEHGGLITYIDENLKAYKIDIRMTLPVGKIYLFQLIQISIVKGSLSVTWTDHRKIIVGKI